MMLLIQIQEEEVVRPLQYPVGGQEYSTRREAGSHSHSAVVGIRRAFVGQENFCGVVFHSYWLY